jgi:nucleotide-binding universal stress UspA family protein
MSIRTILAAAGGSGATTGAIDLGCQLARRFDAHLEVLHVAPDQDAVVAVTGESLGGPGSAAMVDAVVAEAGARAAQARASFAKIVARHGLAHDTMPQLAPHRPSASWCELSGSPAAVVARHSRFFDLVVLGSSDRAAQEPHSDTIEETLLGSGRPVLLAPVEPPSGIGYVIAVAWNGSPQVVRALTTALPLLAKASAVTLLTAGDAAGDDAAPAVDYLAWHSIRAETRRLAHAGSREIGRVLLDAAKEASADLLVMGAYGQAMWREQLFGGATRSLLATDALPLFLMH